jgi:two-component sensor histidine kinase
MTAITRDVPVRANKGAATPGTTADVKRRWEYADLIVASAVALVVIIFAVFALLIWQGYAQTINSAKARAETAAANIANEAQWVVSANLVFLDRVERGLAGDPQAMTAEQRANFDDALTGFPGIFHLGVYDAAGDAVLNGTADQLPVSIGDTSDFAELAAGKEWTLFTTTDVSVPGQAPFAVARRLTKDGAFAGIAMLAAGEDLLAGFAEPMKLGTDAAISLLRSDGWLVARYPALKEPINVGTSPNLQMMNETESGSYLSGPSQVDGISRIVGYRHVADRDFIAIASLSIDAVLGPLWYSVWVVTFLIAPIALALLAGSLLTARLLRQTVQTSRHLKAALEHNEVLFREIHHRVKNNLQSVVSLLQMHPIAPGIKADMGQRITAMSAVHEHIYRSNNFSTVAIKEYLETLVEGIRAGQNPTVKVVTQIDNLSVDRDAATPIGLIVNEVVSNAFKHAFADGRDGLVTVTLSSDAQGDGVLTVEDNGPGFDPSTPSKGIGRKLISALTTQIGGTSGFVTDGGSRFTLTFPLKARAPTSQP